MPAIFDTAVERRIFDSFTRDFLVDRCREVPEFPGNAAVSNLPTVISAFLLGRSAEVREPLAILAQWFERANAEDEQFGEGPHFHAAIRNDSYGICSWLLTGTLSSKPYEIAMGHWQRHFDCEGKKTRRGPPKFDYAAQRYEDPEIRGLAFQPKEILHGSLPDYLASCVQCGQFARGAALFEKVGGKTDIPDSRIQTDIHLGYWLCKHGRDGRIPEAACRDIGARMLRSNLQSRWLGAGQYQRAAGWLKIVAQFGGGTIDPSMVFAQAFDFMPKVDRKA